MTRIRGGCVLLLLAVLTTGCGSSSARRLPVVNVLYAGSLVRLNESVIGPDFTHVTGYPYQGEGKGSFAIANLMKDHLRVADVFESADMAADQALATSASGGLVRWWVTIAGASLVIGYNPRSRFASLFRQAAAGDIPWYQALSAPGMRIGRTDPAIDPKGYRTIWALQLAEAVDHVTGLRQRILGANENPDQIFTEESLVSRLQSGELDAGFFYSNEALQAKVPVITLPPTSNQSAADLATLYATMSYTLPSGQVVHGSPIAFTATVPTNAANAAGGVAFVHFLLSPAARSELGAYGLTAVPAAVGGDAASLPTALRADVTAAP